MATITAKFNGSCKKCGTFLPAGTTIEWSKGSGATCAGGCKSGMATATSSHSRGRAPSEPLKVGVCEGPAALFEFLGFTKLSPTGELGKSFRAGKRAGTWAGKIVTVIGVHRTYQSTEDNEDMGDMQGGGWTFSKWVREATAEEAAKVEAGEVAKAEAKRIADEAVAAKKAAADAQAAACRVLLEGLVSSDGYGLDMIAERGEVVGTAPGTYQRTIRQVKLSTGDAAYHVSDNSTDDWRDAIYAPAEVVEKIWAAAAAERNTTVEQADEWLSKYTGCYGAGYYRFVAKQGKAA